MKRYFLISFISFIGGIFLSLVSCGKYEQRGGKIYYSSRSESWGKTERVLEGVDLSSFKSLGRIYAKDKNKVYYRGLTIKGADANSFKILSDIYSVDSKHIFMEERLLSTANPNTFIILKDEYALDAERVYFKNDTLKEADPTSFRTIGHYYAKDAYHVYDQGRILAQVSDVTSFKLIVEDGFGVEWACDKNYYYYGKHRLDVDYATFALIDRGKDGYAKDKNVVYYCTWLEEPTTVEGADPVTFKMVGKYKNVGKDKNGYYWEGKRKQKEELEKLL